MIVTRRYKFSASHRLHVPQLSDSENRQLFGKCNYPHGHGHDYVLEVSVRGPVDSATGRVLNIRALDRHVRDKVVDIFDHRDMNHDISDFAALVPTTENISTVVDKRLREGWERTFGDCKLVRIRIQETRRNTFELNTQ